MPAMRTAKYAGADDAHGGQGIQIQAHAAQHKKHDIDRRRHPADLLEERLVTAHVDVRGAQQHAAQQGRYIQRGAACRDEKYKRARQHQPVVRGAAVKQHAQQPSQQIGRQQHACIHRQRSDHALPVHHRGFRAGGDGRTHAESQQGHRVVHGYHLHQGVDERALGRYCRMVIRLEAGAVAEPMAPSSSENARDR